VRSVNHAEALALAEEQALVVAAESGDPDACRKLVELYMPAIAGIALRFPTGSGIELQELLQQGVVGLLFAARRFDARLNTPFWAYASFWVRKAMQELVAELTRPVALSDRAVRALAQIRMARRGYLQAQGTEPTNEQLSDATGFTLAQLESLQAADRTPRGFEEPLAYDAETSATVGDTLVDPVAEQTFEQVLDEMEIREARDVTDRLTERERAVIRAHYGLGQPAQTFDQIGGELGLTAERARQIEVGALTRMRDALAQPAPARAGLI
jgi:RNA polymerase primary sigma factor